MTGRVRDERGEDGDDVGDDVGGAGGRDDGGRERERDGHAERYGSDGGPLAWLTSCRLARAAAWAVADALAIGSSNAGMHPSLWKREAMQSRSWLPSQGPLRAAKCLRCRGANGIRRAVGPGRRQGGTLRVLGQGEAAVVRAAHQRRRDRQGCM
ncbi:hypothetical protein L1887_62068 [Cichorium endivia]|nr:hypothetical protein L1887_62068 [Cichorium endivia]